VHIIQKLTKWPSDTYFVLQINDQLLKCSWKPIIHHTKHTVLAKKHGDSCASCIFNLVRVVFSSIVLLMAFNYVGIFDIMPKYHMVIEVFSAFF